MERDLYVVYNKEKLLKDLTDDHIKICYPLEIVHPFSNISPNIVSRKTGTQFCATFSSFFKWIGQIFDFFPYIWNVSHLMQFLKMIETGFARAVSHILTMRTNAFMTFFSGNFILHQRYMIEFPGMFCHQKEVCIKKQNLEITQYFHIDDCNSCFFVFQKDRRQTVLNISLLYFIFQFICSINTFILPGWVCLIKRNNVIREKRL